MHNSVVQDVVPVETLEIASVEECDIVNEDIVHPPAALHDCRVWSLPSNAIVAHIGIPVQLGTNHTSHQECRLPIHWNINLRRYAISLPTCGRGDRRDLRLAARFRFLRCQKSTASSENQARGMIHLHTRGIKQIMGNKKEQETCLSTSNTGL